jgi:hypothetical protein
MAYVRDGRYVYQSLRIGGRVTSVYLGSGPAAVEVAAANDAILEDRRRGQLERRRAEEEQRALLAGERDRGRGLRRIVAVVLEAFGYIQYQRNPWRRRAMRQTELARPDATPPGREAIRSLVARVHKGEQGALPDLAAMARLHPRLVASATCKDLAYAARLMLAARLSGEDRASEVGFTTRIDLVASDLAGEGASPALRLCAQVVAFSWAEYWVLSIVSANNLANTHPMQLKRQDAAQRRFLAALRAYSRIASLEGRPAAAGNLFTDTFK